MRIRPNLFLLVIAVLLPTVLGAALGVAYIHEQQQEAYRKSIQETAHAMALVLDREFVRRETLLNTLAAAPSLLEGNLGQFHTFASKLTPTREKAVILQDTAGNVLLNSRRPFATKSLAQEALVELRRRSAPEATIISDVFLAPVAQTYSFAIQVPVKKGDSIAYYLTLSAFASQLQQLLSENQLPEGWFGTIVDRDGVIAARTKDAQRLVGKQVPEEQRRFMQEQSEGFLDITTLHGIPATVFIARAPKSGWTFVVGVPRSQLQQPANEAVMIMSVIAASALALALLIAYFIGRRISTPMEALRAAATKLSQGEPIMVQHSGIVEIDAVSSEMAHASQEIHDTRAHLERRVAEAVSASEQSQRALLQAQKLEALGRLTGGIAHDFNNVLQTLTTGLQMAHLNSADPRVKQSLEACLRAVKRAADLVRQLMAFGRVQDAHLTVVNLAQKVRDITPMLKGGLRGDIQLHFNIAENVWPVRIDPLQFELALLNLCINARDAMPGGGTLEIGIHNRPLEKPVGDVPLGDYVMVCISDSGEGMSPEVVAKALDPFFTTKGVGKGTGLGLAQVYGFIRQANGTVAIDSAPGEGTTIKLYLPRVDTATEPEAQQRSALAEPPSSLEGRVLLVDDDLLVLDVVKPALEAAGLQVRVAQNGDDALILLNAGEHFDLVFSDIVMPGHTNGIDLAGFIRQQLSGTKVILATGYTEQRVDLPGVRVLRKPYSIPELLDAVRKETAIVRRDE